ncbi:DNA polymerase III subunit alpha [Candidatus Gracilibacteria bacterium]|nr:DNA polymerase III subunit alpha [Candidatus Gracilibacteria bacterium]
MFTHLHNHTHFSILEGLPKPIDYVKKAVALGMTSVAITDTMNVYGCHEFYKKAKDNGIKPILGSEIYVEGMLDKNISHKLVLLAKSKAGYNNLIEIITKTNLDGSGRINIEDIKPFSHDLVALSGPIGGEIPFYILSGEKEEAIMDRIKAYQKVFGADNFYLELLEHKDIPKQDLVTARLVELHNKYNVGVVACNNCYYINKEDKKTQDVIQALGTGHTIDNHDRPSLKNGDYSFLSEEEMNKLFGYIPVALENTERISTQVDINIEMGKILIPVFKLPEEIDEKYKIENTKLKEEIIKLKTLNSDERYLRYLCFHGMNTRFKTEFTTEQIEEFIKKIDIDPLAKSLQDSTVEELRQASKKYFTPRKKEIIATLDEKTIERIDRLEYELFVVHKMGFDTYFLIVSDYIMRSKNNGIPVGPGRGSAAGALLAYLTGITDIEPMQFDLLFERFLNPARVSMPDIDTDFADNGRDQVIDYCRDKYGADHLAQICTFGTFAARAAVKDVGRVRGVLYTEMNELAKLIPEKPGTKLIKALEESIEFKKAYDENPLYKEIIDDALKIEGNVRQIGVHACAVIIAPEKMTSYTALQHPPKDSKTIITQYSAYPLEDLGLLKMDFLGLRNLSIIKRTGKILKKNKDIDLDILGISLDDKNVLDIFAAGDTTGVFQFESDGMRMWLRNLKPTSFNDIIAMVALYRPGPMQFIETYINRKYGKEEIDYMYEDLAKELEKKYGKKVIAEERTKLFEDLSSFMDITYGIAVYQEQLMRIVQSMAGFSLAEADMLRRGVGKKKKDVVEKLKIEFISKAETFRGYKPETSRTIYEKMIMPAADYSFNKSHAACYALIAYETAYLKAYHRTEFITAMMVSDEEDLDRISLEVTESLNNGINILPPSVNESLKHFTYIDDNNIRFGLKAIKGLGDGPINKIIETREDLEGGKFKSLEEFVKLVGKEVINKKSLEALVKSGSLDDLGDRSEIYNNMEDILRFAKQDDNKKSSSQIGLFDMNTSDFQEKLVLRNRDQIRYEEKLFFEKEVLGFMVSGHPLDGLKRYCEKRSSNTKHLKMSLDELKLLYEKEETDEKKKKFLGDIREKPVKTIGVITDVRKIITKTGKNMVFLTCEGFDYDFEVTIFDREFNDVKDSIAIGKIILVEGNLNIDLEYGRRAVGSRKSIIITLSKVRDQARDLSMFDNFKRGIRIVNKSETIVSNEVKYETAEIKEIKTNTENGDSESEEEVVENNCICIENDEINNIEYIIPIPTHAKKTDLQDLKTFLQTLKTGKTQVFIDLKGQKIDTKISVSEIDKIVSWEQEKWS